jgi:hypothetical protein
MGALPFQNSNNSNSPWQGKWLTRSSPAAAIAAAATLCYAATVPGLGAVRGLVGIEGSVVSGVINLESPGVQTPGRRPTMTSVTTKPELSQPTIENNSHLFADWFDPIEIGNRDRG